MWPTVMCFALAVTATAHADSDYTTSSSEEGGVGVSEIKGLWSPLLDWALTSREQKVMKQSQVSTMQQLNVVTGVHKITRPTGPPSSHQGSMNGVSETDLYLLGAIEKLVYRVDFMEKRLRRTEEVVYYLMAGGSGDKDRTDPCPANFTRSGRNCYHFSRRQFNWKSAASMCKSLGSNLAEMETIEENQDIVTFIQANQDLRGTDYWTGGLNPGLLWIWANSARPVSSNSTSSANTNIKGNGRCLKLAYNPALRSYSYQGSDCSSRTNFICEYEDNTTGRAIERIAKSLKDRKSGTVEEILERHRNSQEDDTTT